MKKRIIISVNNNLFSDQRVEKTCKTLENKGYKILLIGNNLRGNQLINRSYLVKIIPVIFNKSFLLFAEFNVKLFFYLLFKVNKKDILWANDLDILLPNFLISRIKNVELIFDSHEYYSELPSVQGRFSQKVWKILEKFMIPKIKKSITVSTGIQKIYQDTYKINPILIANYPRKYIIDFYSEKIHKRKFIIYQGAINPFRGIDKMILAMKNINEVDLLIVGNGLKLQEYKQLIINEKLENKVYFLGDILPEKLRKITFQAEFGLSLEENAGKSYYYSLPNKLFDYIHAEIPILGTYLPEIHKIITENNIGLTIENHSINEIQTKINQLLKIDKYFLRENLLKAKLKYNWEIQEQKILDLVTV